jgi:hypothetical protein
MWALAPSRIEQLGTPFPILHCRRRKQIATIRGRNATALCAPRPLACSLKAPDCLALTKLRYFVLAAALLASVSSAHAELQELARSGAWRAVADKSGDAPVCAMEAYSYSDHRMLMIKWARGTTSMSVHLCKPNWIIPERTELTLKIQFDGVVSFID